MQGAAGEDTQAPPKRTYVGIKLKRQAISGMGMNMGMGAMMGEDKRPRQDQNFDFNAPNRGGFQGLGAFPGSFPGMGAGFPAFPPRANGPMSGFSGNPMGPFASPEEQLRWYEQFFQMQQMQAQQQQQQQGGAPFFFNSAPPFPHNTSFGGYNPFLAGTQQQFGGGGNGGTPFPGGSAPYGFMSDTNKFPGGGAQLDPYMAAQQQQQQHPASFPGPHGFFVPPGSNAMYPNHNHTGGMQGAAGGQEGQAGDATRTSPRWLPR